MGDDNGAVGDTPLNASVDSPDATLKRQVNANHHKEKPGKGFFMFNALR